MQKEKFHIAANKLLNHCFLLKKKEDTKKDYVFVRQNLEMFVTYFDLLGYDVKVNEDQGVIGLVNQFGTVLTAIRVGQSSIVEEYDFFVM